jgi:ribosomal protein L29
MAKKDTMTTKNDQELVKLLSETRETLRSERFAAAGARAKNPNVPGALRKTIARVLTEQRSRAAKAAQ